MTVELVETGSPNLAVTPTQVGAYASLSELDVAISTSVHCERCDVSAWLHMS